MSAASLDAADVENKRLRAQVEELGREIMRRAAKYFAGETRW
ncbi:hypothetical protein ACFV90_11390 [Streptomyces sp. NPDC059904]